MPSLAQTATLVHGYSLADVERAARTAVRKRSYTRSLVDDQDRYETAWHGVVEELYSCGCGRGACTRDRELTFFELILAAGAAISKAANDQLRHHGRMLADPSLEAANFSKFWLPVRKSEHRTDDGFSDQLCERLALRTALGVLNTAQYEALVTLAAYDNVAADAAGALGLKYNAYHYRLQTARSRLREAWFSDEPAGEQVATAAPACKRGHPRAEHGEFVETGINPRWVCRECKRITDREGARRRREAKTASKVLQAERHALAQSHAEPAA